MSSEQHRQNINGQVARLFSAFERGVQPERAARYVESLKSIPLDRLERCVSWVIDHWEEKSPPTIAKLRTIAWRGDPGSPADDDAERERLKQLKGYLADYSDEDQHEWQRAFSYVPTHALFDRMQVKVPRHVAFRLIPKVECDVARKAARDACHASFARLGAKHGTSLVTPESLAQVVARDARDAAQRATNEELPF